MSKTEQVQQTIQEAVRAIDATLTTASLAESGPMSRRQLLRFREILQKMLQAVEGAESPTQLPRVSGMGQIIVDSWPLDSLPGEAILRAEQEYADLLKEKRDG